MLEKRTLGKAFTLHAVNLDYIPSIISICLSTTKSNPWEQCTVAFQKQIKITKHKYNKIVFAGEHLWVKVDASVRIDART